MTRDLLAPFGAPPDLAAVLANREDRVARQHTLLSRYGTALVSCGVNMPGPVKDNLASRRVLAAAVRAVQRVVQASGWLCLERAVRVAPTGPEALVVVKADPRALKAALLTVEESQPWGRLVDLDVLPPAGPAISRADLGLPPRACLVCGEVATVCARSRRHPLEAVLAQVITLVTTLPGGKKAPD